MKIQKIYDKYKIMPQLRLHQLRVAGVASLIVDNFEKQLDKDSIISACLLHDMGNVLKFRRDWFFDMVEDPTEEKWQESEKIRKEFSQKYGKHEDDATINIAKEIGVPERVIKLIEGVGFSKAKLNSLADDFEIKIVNYSDQRVDPHGIVSLNERLIEGKKRYSGTEKDVLTEEEYQQIVSATRELEKQIFQHTKISPDDISGNTVGKVIESFKSYDVTTQ